MIMFIILFFHLFFILTVISTELFSQNTQYFAQVTFIVYFIFKITDLISLCLDLLFY